MDSRCLVKPWATVIGLGLFVAGIGCSQAVLLTQEAEQGGVLTYLFKEDLGGRWESPYRRDALKLIEGKCPTGYIALEEGEVQGYSSMSPRVEQKEKLADGAGRSSSDASSGKKPA